MNIIFECDRCHVFRLPPSGENDRSELWEGNHIWTGRCQVAEAGPSDSVEVRLVDTESGQLFGCCPINNAPGAPKAVQPATDSRRCFILRLEQQGRHAYIGINFEERTWAFDFERALTSKERKESQIANLASVPIVDRSLKDGEVIHVDLKVRTKGDKVVEPSASSAPRPAGQTPLITPPGGIAKPPGASGGSRRIAF